MNYLEEKEGSIFFIPLFLPNNIKDIKKNYSKYKFESQENYAFGRLIEINKSSGDLVEIFNYTGPIPIDENIIIKSGILIDPTHVAMGFSTKRWRFVFETKNYNRNIDSNYSELTFLLGTENDFEVWKGGTKSKISNNEAKKYKRWTVHHPTRIEETIRSKDFSMII